MNILRTLLATVVAIGAGSTARADIIIDDFSTPSTAISYQINGSNPNPSTFTTVLPSGTTRNVTLTVTAPATPFFDSLTGSIGGPPGLFEMSLDVSSSGTAKLNYTFASATNFIPNVASGGAVGSLEFNSLADTGFSPTAPVSIAITTATGTLTSTGVLNATASFAPTDFSLSSFTGTGDLTQVTGLSITITAGQAADLEIDALSITTPQPEGPVPTPAPPAALLALLALPALGLRNRGAKKEITMA